MVIDLNLPGEDGISLARRIRQSQPDIGIIMVTARNQVSEKMHGYENGADIYLTKPTSIEELSAAIHALSRRLKPSATAALKLDLNKLSLSGEQSEVNLTAHEAMLLAALVRAPGHMVEYWQLIEILSKDETNYSKASLEVQIVRLRKKLQLADAGEHSIKAIRQMGYQLCLQVKIV
jgi:DNA-binding response OmpR family regulator